MKKRPGGDSVSAPHSAALRTHELRRAPLTAARWSPAFDRHLELKAKDGVSRW